MSTICKICDKQYASVKSMQNHTNKFHKVKVENVNQPVNQTVNQKLTNEKYNCDKCNKTFNTRQAKWKHCKKCEVINKSSQELEIELLKKLVETQRETFEKELAKVRNEMKNYINKNCKTHPKTLTKINKQLTGNYNNIANTVNDNKTINNNTYNIIALGHEDLMEVFSKNEKLKVLKNRNTCLDFLVKYTHFNEKFPQFKNILITNTQNSLAYKYDNNENQFIAINKDELLDELINERMSDITFFYEQLENDLDEKTKQLIENFIDNMDDDKFKDTKKKDIKLIIYNNRNKVSKEVTQNLEIIV